MRQRYTKLLLLATLVTPLLGIAGEYGSGTFYLTNNTANTLNIKTLTSNCATHISYATDSKDASQATNLSSGQSIILQFDYADSCGQEGGEDTSHVRFALTQNQKEIAQFDASIGSIQNPQDAYYRAYPQSKLYQIGKPNAQTLTIEKVH